MGGEVRSPLADSNSSRWRRVPSLSFRLGHKADCPVAFHRFLGRVDGRPGARLAEHLQYRAIHSKRRRHSGILAIDPPKRVVQNAAFSA